MKIKTATLTAALLFSATILVFAKEWPGLAGAQAGEADVPRSPQPWYDLPADARDPFLPPAARSGQVDESESIGREEIQAAVNVSIVSTSLAFRSAIVNNRLVRPGDTISVEILGKEIAMKVIDIDSDDAGVVLSHDGQEFFIPKQQRQ